MIAETPESPRRGWPLWLKIALFAGIAAIVAAALIISLTSSGDDSEQTAATGDLVIPEKPDDPLTEAVFRSHDRRPLIGQDHWHASYVIYIGDTKLPNAPTWESGVHTHGDGIIHIHPFQHFEEGSGASLTKWFEYGGGELTETTLREPGDQKTYHAGDPVAGGSGEIFVIQSSGGCDSLDLTGQWVRVPIDYIPHDGDCIRIMFEPEQVMRDHIKNPPGIPTTSARPCDGSQHGEAECSATATAPSR